MFTFPNTIPRDDMWINPPTTTRATATENGTNPLPNPPQGQNRRLSAAPAQQSRNPGAENEHHHPYIPLAQRDTHGQLRRDEETIDQRKSSVRNFGSHWIRPPAITRTLQQIRDDDAETHEREEAERRERELLELQEAAEGEDGAVDVMEDGEDWDLDAQIPDAETEEEGENEEEEEDSDEEMTEESEEDGEEEEEEEEEGEYEENEENEISINGADPTFNASSFMEGSLLSISANALLGASESGAVHFVPSELASALQEHQELDLEQADPDGDFGHNLDDDIPSAGSYEHTDTEAEDFTDSEEEPGVEAPNPFTHNISFASTNSVLRPGATHQPPLPLGLEGVTRESVGTEFDLEFGAGDSSFVASSPVMRRARPAAEQFQQEREAQRRRSARYQAQRSHGTSS
ncbi:hypothetical protein EJ06DRAFT_559341 [Trichodelitschia bisporula]|uniref:Uncharacterized protein n=1 Tax=Trichodelitschia bisporula TaxID=703511 RepID=A0A6G1HMD4_9PEZI|nr:hypothetical protein EJ06DRAFT_559341 [Trichodelitschia bisporula]